MEQQTSTFAELLVSEAEKHVQITNILKMQKT